MYGIEWYLSYSARNHCGELAKISSKAVFLYPYKIMPPIHY